jgi:hypothetical protein
MDWFDFQKDIRAKKLISQAEQGSLDFVAFMKEATKKGVAADPNVQSFAKLLREDQLRKMATEKQSAITGAVGRAIQTPSGVPNTSNEQLRQMQQTMPPEQYAQTLTSDTEKYLGNAPKKEEDFMGAMGRQQLPAEATFEDVQANPAFQFAKGQFPSESDELARARLKVQQDAEARKNRQIDKANELQGWRQKNAKEQLEFDKLKLQVTDRQQLEGTADKWYLKAAQADADAVKAKAELKRWESQLNNAGTDKADPELADFSPQQIVAQIAMYEETLNNLEARAKEWRDVAASINDQSRFEKVFGMKGKARPRADQPAALPPQEKPPERATTPAPAPTTGGLDEAIAKKYKID